jgi:hypothetical protein
MASLIKNFGDRNGWAAALILVLTPVYYLLPRPVAPGVETALAVAFVVLYLIALPGWIIASWLMPRRSDPVEKMTIAILTGFAGFMAASFAAALAQLDLAFVARSYPIAAIALSAAALVWRGLRRASAYPEIDAPLPRGDRILLAIFAAELLCIFILVLGDGVPLTFTADTLDHVAYVNEIAETKALFPTTAFYSDPGSNGADLRKGLFHVFYGLMCGRLGVDALGVLNAANAFLAVLLLLSVYASGWVLFRNRGVAVLSSLLFLLAVDEGLRENGARLSFFTQRFGIAFFLPVLAYGLRWIKRTFKRDLAAVAVFSFAAAATHIFFGVLIAFAGMTILVWKFCFPMNDARAHLRRAAVLGASMAFGVVPFVLYRYVTAFPEANELHREVQGVVFITSGLYIADPIQVYRWFGPVGILTFVAVFALWRERHTYVGLGYVYASFFTLIAVLFNPILLPPVRSAMTYLIARLPILVPFYFAAAWYLVSFASRKSGEARWGFMRRALGILFAVALVYHIIPVFGENGLSPSRVESERAASCLKWRDALDNLSAKLPRGSVICSDPLTSYSVTAFTPHYTVATFDQHAPPNDVLLEQRMQAARAILSPYVPAERATALMADYHATHVVLNDRFPANVRLEYWSMNHEMFGAMRQKFDGHPEAFACVYDHEGFVVYSWNGQPARPDPLFTPLFMFGRLPGSLEAVGKIAGDAILEGILLSEEKLSPGHALDIKLAWSGRGQYAFGNYAVVVRFDHVSPDLPFGGKPFPKLVRKMKEKITGRSYRFTEFHKIRSGFLSPDVWPAGKIILDETRVHVPPRAAPGLYRVSVKLITLQHQPTYRLKDIFSDDDVYAGIPVARVTIR